MFQLMQVVGDVQINKRNKNMDIIQKLGLATRSTHRSHCLGHHILNSNILNN